VTATIDALGPTRIHETALRGVWLVEYLNADEQRIALHLEIDEVPRPARACAARGVAPRISEVLRRHRVSMMALPPSMAPAIAAALEKARRPSVIWLSFQECTGCTESLTRSFSPTVENLIFDTISLDYHHTLQAAAGEAAEHAREQAMQANEGEYLVVVDGSLPAPTPTPATPPSPASATYDMLMDTVAGAAAVVAVGTCAAFGGLPKADPNPSGAVAVQDMVKDKPVINVSGCPPVPMVITGVLAQYLTFGSCRSWTSTTARWPSSASPSTTAATAAPSTTRACSPRPSTTRARRRAGACTASAARGR
jgi:hypothetical protein